MKMTTTPLEAAIAAMDAIGNDPENELPEPFNQRYANLYLLLEDFIVDAVEAGVDADLLYRCIDTDAYNIITNHGGWQQ
jgi:hypothetical protein